MYWYFKASIDPGILPRNLDPDPPYPSSTSPSDGIARGPMPRDLKVRSDVWVIWRVNVRVFSSLRLIHPLFSAFVWNTAPHAKLIVHHGRATVKWSVSIPTLFSWLMDFCLFSDISSAFSWCFDYLFSATTVWMAVIIIVNGWTIALVAETIPPSLHFF